MTKLLFFWLHKTHICKYTLTYTGTFQLLDEVKTKTKTNNKQQ